MMDISGKDKAKVLCALYDNARTQGLGIIHHTPEPMSEDEARELLEHNDYFDYVRGRVMKVSLSSDELDTRLYNRDNGEGAAERAINAAFLA